MTGSHDNVWINTTFITNPRNQLIKIGSFTFKENNMTC